MLLLNVLNHSGLLDQKNFDAIIEEANTDSLVPTIAEMHQAGELHQDHFDAFISHRQAISHRV